MPDKRIPRRMILMTGMILLLAAAGITAGLHAKYVTQVSLTGSVEFSSELAKSLVLNESRATLTGSGRYSLDPSQKVLENSYKVMPGVNLPKDPAVTVTDRTGIPAYLFIEIEEQNIPASVTYSLCDHWEQVTDTDHVYVYTGDDFTAPIRILKDDTLVVSAQYGGEAFDLNFTARLYQKLSNETPAQTYARESGD